ncbi:hypothetical protein AJ80_08075 [Polytolypa hystricis UAMH7299]|uniref:MobA-like NTP transferase domain-containing protein n=1 Tax=Polytolypa hystricis (strain UAMH7299) TaxID=1447883 RepID=A0A2B7XEA0_POLH7|nr:hypothetical protein AJ80_08075 [Polytolypa hystricis UAMH7299]
MILKPILLAGGQSSRMGRPKHLLPFIDGQPLYMHLLKLLKLACPASETIYMSLRDTAQQVEHSPKGSSASQKERGNFNIQFIYDGNGDERSYQQTDIGPASGLIAAHHHNPTAHWLVVACDFPLLTLQALQQLHTSFEEPVTCFRNRDGYCEPLLGIWGPEALRKLENNVAHGITGPSFTVKELGGAMINAEDEKLLFNANTNEEWAKMVELLNIN